MKNLYLIYLIISAIIIICFAIILYLFFHRNYIENTKTKEENIEKKNVDNVKKM